MMDNPKDAPPRDYDVLRDTKILGSCESPHRLFTVKRFELPNKTVCIHCQFYRSDDRTP